MSHMNKICHTSCAGEDDNRTSNVASLPSTRREKFPKVCSLLTLLYDIKVQLTFENFYQAPYTACSSLPALSLFENSLQRRQFSASYLFDYMNTQIQLTFENFACSSLPAQYQLAPSLGNLVRVRCGLGGW